MPPVASKASVLQSQQPGLGLRNRVAEARQSDSPFSRLLNESDGPPPTSMPSQPARSGAATPPRRNDRPEQPINASEACVREAPQSTDQGAPAAAQKSANAEAPTSAADSETATDETVAKTVGDALAAIVPPTAQPATPATPLLTPDTDAPAADTDAAAALATVAAADTDAAAALITVAAAGTDAAAALAAVAAAGTDAAAALAAVAAAGTDAAGALATVAAAGTGDAPVEAGTGPAAATSPGAQITPPGLQADGEVPSPQAPAQATLQARLVADAPDAAAAAATAPAAPETADSGQAGLASQPQHGTRPSSAAPNRPHAHEAERLRTDSSTSDFAQPARPAPDGIQLAGLHSGRDFGQMVAATAQATSTADDATNLVATQVPLESLAVEITARAQGGRNRFEIRLDPPELGRIEVRLDIDRSGQVTSRLLVERPETLDVLRRDAHQLERALQDAGLKTSDNGLQFELRDQAFADRNDTADTPRAPIADADSPAAESTPVVYGLTLRGNGGIDIRI